MAIEVKSLTEILIDDVNAGSALDVARNHPNLGGDVQRALEAWDVARQSKSQESHAAEIAKLNESHSVERAKSATVHAAEVANLNSQLGGVKGDYKVTINAVQQLALEIEYTTTGVSPAEWIASRAFEMLAGLAVSKQDIILQDALTKFPLLAKENKLAVMTSLGLGGFAEAVSDSPELLKILAPLVAPRFRAAPVEVQNAILEKVMKGEE